MTVKKLEVAAGIIIKNGKCLITRRPRGGHLEGLWEFPGGKFLVDESAEDCLRREVYEEVGLRIEIERPLPIIDHGYPDRNVRLHFFLCRPVEKRQAPKGSLNARWVPIKDLEQYPFPEANIPILQLLKDF